MIDRFHCPVQRTEDFTFNACIGCKWLEISKGQHMTVRCRRNKNTQDARAFESAFLLNRLGLPWQVEIIEEVTL